MQSGLKVIWLEDDPTIPEGWKTRTTEVKTKAGLTTMQWFLSPEGRLFRGRKSALNFIQTSGAYSKDDVKTFKSKPAADKKFTKEYDWRSDDPTVPPGWRSTVIFMNSFGKMVRSLRFLAPDGRFCTNRIDALRYMAKEGLTSPEDMATMKNGLLVDGWLVYEAAQGQGERGDGQLLLRVGHPAAVRLHQGGCEVSDGPPGKVLQGK